MTTSISRTFQSTLRGRYGRDRMVVDIQLHTLQNSQPDDGGHSMVEVEVEVEVLNLCISSLKL